MITENIKNKLYDEFLFKLHEEICFDEHFHVDVELKTKQSVFSLVSTLYAEGGEEIYTDYDQPREWERPCISCNVWNLVELDGDGDVHYYEKEAEEIILQAINNYRP